MEPKLGTCDNCQDYAELMFELGDGKTFFCSKGCQENYMQAMQVSLAEEDLMTCAFEGSDDPDIERAGDQA